MTNDDYDDCPICQVMKAAEAEGRNPNQSELKKAFIESGKQGAIVGGPLLEDDSSN